MSTTAATPATIPNPPLRTAAPLCVGAAVLLELDGEVLDVAGIPLELDGAAPDVVPPTTAESVIETDGLVTNVAGVVTVAVLLVTEPVAVVMTAPTLVAPIAAAEAADAEDAETDAAEAASDGAPEATDAALLSEDEREASGPTGTGTLDITGPMLEEAVAVAGASVIIAELLPATLEATTASSEAADAAFADTADAWDIGVGAATTAGASVTGPVGMDAEAGNCIEVVKP